ncbi:drug:h+ antiporter [Coniophora puteana RWD-64-598 SS2]|uniref:Drug:h+ antiporter n=1 Tax=Coniophora puteana (strain RWD-64-598) TaxID=741705 RepID=A0A5M3MNR4_CONPW|nr:drug:h+ antiporter [Coniophora puteana RWD-64-598 SS2]EIW80434.1 drug:h+ antiporter [Coniophora puteana RWD-64-598 SS2]
MDHQGKENSSATVCASALDTERAPSLATDKDGQASAKKLEATRNAFTHRSRWSLFIGLGLVAYANSLDISTTDTFLTFATSSLGAHSLLSAVTVAQLIVVAVGQPVIAKVADVSSRGIALFAALFFYVIGYVIIATAPNIGALAGGTLINAINFAVLLQIIIADITSLKWRGFVSSLTAAPTIINSFVGSNVTTAVIEHSSWRWGYGMFAIITPAATIPLLLTLFWAERRAKKLVRQNEDVIPQAHSSTSSPKTSWLERWKDVVHVGQQIDVIGLVLFGAAISLILLPLTLNQTSAERWRSGDIITMLVLGVVCLIAFAWWDIRKASWPLIPKRCITNRSVVCAALIGFFDFLTLSLTSTYLYSFILIAKPWSLIDATYFMKTRLLSLSVFLVLAGLFMRVVRRYKLMMIAGVVIRLVGLGMMIRFGKSNGSDVGLVWTQILQGMGPGLFATSSQVAAQASVSHKNVAMVTAVVLLLGNVGGAVGSAMAGAIWSNTIPANLEKYLPNLSDAERERLYASITSVMKYPRGNPIREGVILAYDDTMKQLIIIATVLSAVPLFLAIVMPEWELDDQQNAVENVQAEVTDHEGELEKSSVVDSKA